MINLDDIKNVKLGKSMGGYKKKEVAKLLKDIIEYIESLKGELADAEKTITTYNAEEDNLKDILKNAQQMASSIVKDAESQSDDIIRDAKIRVKNMQQESRKQIYAEGLALDRAKKEVSKFKNELIEKYKEHLELVTSISSADYMEDVPEAIYIDENENEDEVKQEVFQDTVPAPTPEPVEEPAVVPVKTQRPLEETVPFKISGDSSIEGEPFNFREIKKSFNDEL